VHYPQKNIFFHKCDNFTGLLGGLPDGSENAELQILEEEVENQGLRVKQKKQENAKVRWKPCNEHYLLTAMILSLQ
jgi:hypothetical protein